MDAIMTHGKWVLIFLSLPFIAFGLFQPDLIMFFIGSNEKNHGYYWYAGLIMLAFIFQVLTSKERKQVMHASMF